ncbi:unnamed protein product [Gongylonema pulchrum]|uniref:ELMO domain-containing protein n=1 Tax=Gongylonema pulchrum TaxID=637853 RepID=A0A183EFT2_9BILA|nr:unnamed protein product [Gongylonema pulchrum]
MKCGKCATSSFYQYIYALLSQLLRTAVKWFMQLATGKSELERILTWQTKNQGQITAEIERLIDDGELVALPDYWKPDEEDELATRIVRKYCPGIDKKQFKQLKDTLRRSLSQIQGYRELCDIVESMRKEKYDPENEQHEKRLLKLWDLLMPDEDLEGRKSEQWQKIGFQGADPSTDFRGMGILSLEQLIFLAQYDVAYAQSILSLSQHPSYGLVLILLPHS